MNLSSILISYRTSEISREHERADYRGCFGSITNIIYESGRIAEELTTINGSIKERNIQLLAVKLAA